MLTATLTAQEWDVIGHALGLRPYAEVAALLEKLRSQLQTPPSVTEPEFPGFEKI